MTSHCNARQFCINLCIGCETPSKPIGGMPYLQSTAVGMVVTYSCDDGLKLTGDTSRECLKSGVWSGSTPVCKCMGGIGHMLQ